MKPLSFLVFLLLGGCALVGFDPLAPSCDRYRPYEWYRSQMDTGPASRNNCGPTCVSMVIKYCNTHDVNVSLIRDIRPKENGWWYASDISYALNYYGIPNTIRSLSSDRDLLQALSRGSLVLACLDMSLITEQSEDAEARYHRFYQGVTGHFLLLKGYTDRQEWIIAYDSNNWKNDYYLNRAPKGRDRFYRAGEIVASMKKWWPYFFEIFGRKNLLIKRGEPDEMDRFANMRSSMEGIPDAWGR